MKLLVILSSVRQGRNGEKVANWFMDQVKADGRFEPELVDLKTLGLSYELSETVPSAVQNSDYEDAATKAWAKKVREADAVAFVTPEYNHGYPASLKNAVDHLYAEWNDKPAAFIGYGSAGATYAHAAFLLVAQWVKLNMINARVGIPEIWAAFDEGGALLHDDYHSYEAKTVLTGLASKLGA